MLTRRNSYVQPRPKSAWIDESFNRAVGFHRNGDLAQAERAYREVLANSAGHAGALHLLGVVMLQTGRLASGVELIDKALAIKPDSVEAFNNRGNALQELKRLDEALASLRQGAGAQARVRRGLQQPRQRAERAGAARRGARSYDKALAIKPD